MSWCEAPWRTRLLRRLRVPAALVAPLGRLSPRWQELAEDLAGWAAVRARVDRREWRRLTSSYSVLVYHRFAGELKPGQERIDIAPGRYYRQLRLLRLLGFRPLPLDELLAFHRGERNELPRRGFAITVDDAIADAIEPLARTANLSPQLFVPTAELGGSAHWIDGEPVAGWEEIVRLAAAGVAIGSHTRHHRRLTRLGSAEREVELLGSLAELRERVPGAAAVIAYPNGDHDDAVCAATDRFRLRRVSVHGADGSLAVLWKVLTGEALPGWWLRLRR